MLCVGIDIGATSVKLGVRLSDLENWQGKTVDSYAIITDIPTHPSFHLTGYEVAKVILNRFGQPDRVAIICFGPLDLQEKKILKAPNMPEWIGQSFTDWEEMLKCEIILENDANGAIFAEAVAGIGKNYSKVAGFTLGGGIGGSLVIDGKIYHGLWDVEPGHMCLDPDGPLCGCGARGCLEAYISTKAITRKFGKLPKELAGREDVWDYYAQYLGWGCQILTTTVNPEIIVLCGGIAKEPGLAEKVQSRCYSLIRVFSEKALPKIVTGAFVPHSGIIGTVELANKN